MNLNQKHTFQRIQVSKNWYLDEFVDPETFFTEVDNGRSKIDDNIINIAQQLRNDDGRTMTCNTWWGYYIKHKDKKTLEEILKDILSIDSIKKWSGLRTNKCKIGSPTSAHKIIKGRNSKCLALDLRSRYKEYHSIIMNNKKSYYNLGLRRIEDLSITVSWLHVDCLNKNTIANHLRIIFKTKAYNVKI
jgi:hypothetical protein